MSNNSSRILRLAGFALVFAGAQVLFARLDRSWPVGDILWPSAGLGLAGLLLCGFDALPVVVVLDFAFRNEHGGLDALLTCGDVLQILSAYYILRRLRSHKGLTSARDALLFIFAVTVAAALGNAMKMGALLLYHVIPLSTWLDKWIAWTRGDALGMMILAPLSVVVMRARQRQFRTQQSMEAALLLVCFLLVAVAAFPSTHPFRDPLTDLFFILVFWGAMRFGLSAAVVLNAAASFACIANVMGQITQPGGRAPAYATTEVWMFLAVLSSTSLVMAAAIVEQRTSEKRFRALAAVLQSTPDWVSTFDHDGRLGFVNEAFRRYIGARYHRGVTFRELTSAARWNDVKNNILPLAEREGVWKGESVVPLVDQPERHISHVIVANKNEQGETEFFTEVARDMTGWVESKRASEEKFALAFRQSPSMLGISRASDGQLVEVNDGFCEFYGAPREDMIGRSTVELGLWPDPAQRAAVVEMLQRDGVLDAEPVQVRRKNGEVRDAVISGGVIRVQGETFFVLRADDVTERKQAEDRLRRSEAEYRELFENANDCIFTADLEGALTAMNQQGREITGLTPEAVTRAHLEDLVFPDQRAMVQKMVHDAATRAAGVLFEIRLRQPKKGAALLEVLLRPIARDGHPVALQGIGRDITERRLLEEKYRQAQKMESMGALAGGIAHDFNNILTIIKGGSALASELVGDDHPAQAEIKAILKAADRAAALTSHLLVFSRQRSATITTFDANTAIREMSKMLGRLIGEDVRIRLDLHPDPQMLLADPTQFDQIVMNLMLNGRDAMPQGGELTIATRPLEITEATGALAQGQYVNLSIADTGVGMQPAVLQHIFEPFFTTKPQGKGTGLGLATVYGIVQQLRGRIDVTSTPGQGTRFTIGLPLSTHSTQIAARMAGSASAGARATILVVEDDADVRRLAERVLTTAGHKLLLASDAADAERILLEYGGSIDLLLTDVIMPGGSAENVVAVLARREPEARVLYMSGYTDGRIPEEFLSGNGAKFLAKPFDPQSLLRKVNEVLNLPRTRAAAPTEMR